MTTRKLDSFGAQQALDVGSRCYQIASLPHAEQQGLTGASRLPVSLKIVLENLLRNEDGRTVSRGDIEAAVRWLDDRGKANTEIAFRPARVLMQDFTGVPALVDLAAMRDAMLSLGGDPAKINPLIPVDLVCDHSLVVDHFGTAQALSRNVALEYQRNTERYQLLKWGQNSFQNLSVVPPGAGICHQVNLELLSQTVWSAKDTDTGREWAYPDTVIGTDSHTTMVNGLAVLGWGVGGIEAEAAMLGQPMSMLIPEVVGFRMSGRLREGITATDLVLTITQMLRKQGVVGKFVEFFGTGLDDMSVANRATISNMAPEYGATCGFFPVDAKTIDYLRTTGRSDERVALVEAYCRAQGIFRDATTADPVFTDVLELDLGTVQASIAGPKRPQDRVLLGDVKKGFEQSISSGNAAAEFREKSRSPTRISRSAMAMSLLPPLPSCTNTSNPSVMLAAGLLARNAIAKGLKTKPWVKTSLSPGSQAVAGYLADAGLQESLDALGFNLVGFGCGTCIGNSGPLPPDISTAINQGSLVSVAVLSGNRNFEGRVNPDVRANYLSSPPLVVAYALAGSVLVDMTKEPLGQDQDGQPVFLRNIWPSNEDIERLVRTYVTGDLYKSRYANVFAGDANWRAVKVATERTFKWTMTSTYVQNPPYFDGIEMKPEPIRDIVDARILCLFLDSITTDHISPAGSIKTTSPAGSYLQEHQVRPADFNQYGTRRGNHEVMMRGTFANIRIKNQMVRDDLGAVVEGGLTIKYPEQQRGFIYDAAMAYAREGVPLVIFAGKEYGTGSSRDWAAKGTRLLGIRAIVAESYERIHRSNLVGMGVAPLMFEPGTTWQSLGLTGAETVSIRGLSDLQKPRQILTIEIVSPDGARREVSALCRIDTLDELEYFRHGGILNFVLRQLAA